MKVIQEEGKALLELCRGYQRTQERVGIIIKGYSGCK